MSDIDFQNGLVVGMTIARKAGKDYGGIVTAPAAPMPTTSVTVVGGLGTSDSVILSTIVPTTNVEYTIENI